MNSALRAARLAAAQQYLQQFNTAIPIAEDLESAAFPTALRQMPSAQPYGLSALANLPWQQEHNRLLSAYANRVLDTPYGEPTQFTPGDLELDDRTVELLESLQETANETPHERFARIGRLTQPLTLEQLMAPYARYSR